MTTSTPFRSVQLEIHLEHLGGARKVTKTQIKEYMLPNEYQYWLKQLYRRPLGGWNGWKPIAIEVTYLPGEDWS